MTADATPLGFGYTPPPLRFEARWTRGTWAPGLLTPEAQLLIDEGAVGLHYGVQCFEGLKAWAGPGGEALLFRLDDNARRMGDSARRVMMPAPPPELFREGVERCVDACREMLPPHGSGGSLYVRPFMLGTGANLGVRPPEEVIFRVFCCPVGPYFKGGLRGLQLQVSDYDRAAPRGTGAFKVGGNYAGALQASQAAKDAGFDEALYLDPLERRYLDEAGTANVFGVFPGEGGQPDLLVTPASESILPSITMRSVLTLAEEDLGLRVERRQVALEEVARMREMAATGTAAGVAPIARIQHEGRDLLLPETPGPVTLELRRLLVGLQTGALPDTRGWVSPVPPQGT